MAGEIIFGERIMPKRFELRNVDGKLTAVDAVNTRNTLRGLGLTIKREQGDFYFVSFPTGWTAELSEYGSGVDFYDAVGKPRLNVIINATPKGEHYKLTLVNSNISV